MGYHRAGFDVVGVDIKPQPHYPFEFHQADAMTVLDGSARGKPEGSLPGWATMRFDVIHASPPCQAYTLMRHMGKRAGEAAPDLVDLTRTQLEASGMPWIMENVVGSPLRNPLMLCGSSFGLGVRRHRRFESSHLLFGAPCNHAPGSWPVAVWGDGRPSRQEARREHRGPIAVYGDHPEDSAIHRAGPDDTPGMTRRAATLEVAKSAMGIDWMEWREITQAIPPAYTEWIGRQLLAALRDVA